MQKTVVLLYPNLSNDGIKKNVILHYELLSKVFNTVIITNSTKLKIEKKNIVNPKKKIFEINKFLNYIYCVFKLYKKFYKEKSLVIISFNESSLLIFINYIFFKKKIIIRTSNPIYNPLNKEEFKYFKKKFFFQYFKLYFYKFADLIWTFSKNNKLYLNKNFNIKNVKVISNIFEKQKLIKRKNIRINKKKYFNIFFIGRLIDIKDPIFIFKSIEKILISKKIRIFFVGEGNLKERIIKISKKYKNNIYYLGFKKNPFKELKNKIDLFCLTSKIDGSPNVLGEAISYGIPSIAPRGIGLSNTLLLNNRGGYLYRHGDTNDFLKKVVHIQSDYKNAIKKIYKAHQNIEKYSYKIVINKLISAIKKL
jgi:hypothetical protein